MSRNSYLRISLLNLMQHGPSSVPWLRNVITGKSGLPAVNAQRKREGHRFDGPRQMVRVHHVSGTHQVGDVLLSNVCCGRSLVTQRAN